MLMQTARSNGTASIPEECFTQAGKLFTAALLSNVANLVVSTEGRTDQNYALPLLVSLQDCFTVPQTIIIGWIGINVVRSKAAHIDAQFSLSLPLVQSQGTLTLAADSESYDLKGWEQLRQDRISALMKFGADTPAGPGACSPHIP